MKAVTYSRVSTDEQKENGTELKGQAERCREYVRRLGYEIVAELEDGGISGKIPIAQRPAGAELYRLVYSRAVDAVILTRSDRLSRDEWGIEGALFHRACYENNVRIHLCDEGGEVRSDMGGRLMLTLGDRMGGEERKKIAERSKMGRLNRVRGGSLMLCGHIPYGYRKRVEFEAEPPFDTMRARSFLEIDEEQEAIVKEIFRLYVVERFSLRRIVTYLNNKGIPSPRGNKKPRPGKGKSEWDVSSLHGIVSSTRYIGEFMYAGYCINRPDLAIIDRDTFTKASELLRTNRNNSPRRTKREYLFRSRITCECGRRLIGKTLHKMGKYTYKEYRCAYQTKEKSTRCPSRKTLSGDYVDAAAWGKLIETLDPALVKAAAREYVATIAKQLKPKQDRLALALAERSDAGHMATEYAKLAGRASANGKLELLAKYEDDLEKELARSNRLSKEIEMLERELSQSAHYDEHMVDKVLSSLDERLANGVPTFEQKRKLVEWANVQGRVEGELIKFRLEIGLEFAVPRSKPANSSVFGSTGQIQKGENRLRWSPNAGHPHEPPDSNHARLSLAPPSRCAGCLSQERRHVSRRCRHSYHPWALHHRRGSRN